MSADLVITEDMLAHMAGTFDDLGESAEEVAPQLPISVDGGIATDIITDLMGTRDYAGSTFAANCHGCADNLRTLVANHQENEATVTEYLHGLKEQMS